MRRELSAADNSSPAQTLGRAQDNPYEGYDRSLKAAALEGCGRHLQRSIVPSRRAKVVQMRKGKRITVDCNNHEAAAYFHTFLDGSGAPLDGSTHSCVLKFAKGQQPTAERFWSLTAYTPRRSSWFKTRRASMRWRAIRQG